MKKIIILILSVFVLGCGPAKIRNAVVVEQINILEGNESKYEVKLKTQDGEPDAYYYTNFRFQVGDTLLSYYQFFEGKDIDVKKLRKENDSLRKELNLSNYYLQLLKEKMTFGK